MYMPKQAGDDVHCQTRTRHLIIPITAVINLSASEEGVPLAVWRRKEVGLTFWVDGSVF